VQLSDPFFFLPARDGFPSYSLLARSTPLAAAGIHAVVLLGYYPPPLFLMGPLPFSFGVLLFDAVITFDCDDELDEIVFPKQTHHFAV